MNEEMNETGANAIHDKGSVGRTDRRRWGERQESACREPLPALLQLRRSERKLKMSEMAECFGIRQSYLSQLLIGDRLFSSLSFSSLRAIAAFLLIPPIKVFLMAGKIQQTDLHVSQADAARQLDTAMRQVAESPFAHEAVVSLAELQALSEPLQYLLMFLHQAATRTTPSPEALQPRWKAFETSPQLALRLNRSE